MRRWLSSLQLRLVVGFVAALALALSSVGLYVGYAADREVDRIRQESNEAREARLKIALGQYYAKNKGWHEVQPFLERVGPVYGKRLILEDKDGHVVGDSQAGGKGLAHKFVRSRRGVTFYVYEVDPHKDAFIAAKKDAVGQLTVDSSNLPESLVEPPLSRLSQAVNRSLLWAGLAAGAGGVVLVTMTSSSALAPVRSLTRAARRLGGGDLAQRVESERKDEVGQLARTFNSMAEGLERAEIQRRNLVADVAHELRSPLSNIQGAVEAMRDGLMDTDDASFGMLHEQTLHLSHLVDDLGLLAQAEAGGLRLDLRPDSLVDVARRSVQSFHARADAKGVSLTMDEPGALPLVLMDRQRVQQVIGNLLDNAIRHTPKGGRVSVSFDTNPPHSLDEDASPALAPGRGDSASRPAPVSVAVEDTGAGIAEDDLSLIFERLHRVDPSRSRATGGAGLGLTIARRLIEAQGGTIGVDSEVGRGSRFVITLPGAGPKNLGDTYDEFA